MNYQSILTTANFDRPGIDILIELIYAANAYTLSKNHSTVGTARKLDQRPDVSTDADTYVPVEIEPAYDDRFPGDNGFMYRRLPASALRQDAAARVTPPGIPFTTHQLIPQLNARFKTQFVESDFVNDEYRTSSVPVVLRFADSSWNWVGQTTVTVEEAAGEVPYGARVSASGFVRVTENGIPRVIASA